MTVPDPTVAEIAGKLTKAQREALLYNGYWFQSGRNSLCGAGPALSALQRKGLCGQAPLRKLSKDGFAVRAFLMEQAG